MTREEQFRRAAEAEDGQPVSAGARVAHVRAAVESGRGMYVDLTAVPSSRRAELVAKIKTLVNEWSSSVADPERRLSGAGGSVSS